MSQAIIRAALEGRLKTWADAEPVTVAWENVEFNPPTSAYLRANLLPNDTEMRDLQGRHRGYIGIFQVSIVLPIGVGAAAASGWITELDTLFSTETPITVGSVRIYITRPMSAAPALQDEGRYIVPVSCEYRSSVYT